jgi:hypothetical protein
VGTCLPSRCPETVLVYPPISRSLHSNGPTRYNIIHRRTSCLPSGLFLSGFPINILDAFFFFPFSYMPCPLTIEGSYRRSRTAGRRRSCSLESGSCHVRLALWSSLSNGKWAWDLYGSLQTAADLVWGREARRKKTAFYQQKILWHVNPLLGCATALLGSRPLNASRPNTRCAAVGEAVSSPCRAVPSRTAPCVVTQQAAMTSHGIPLASNATPL